MAHELNNLLAAIAAFAELLGVDPNQADLKESADIIRTEAIRAGRIVRTLLDFARQRPRMEVAVDLAEVFERVLAAQLLGEPGARYDALLVDVHLDDEHSGFDVFEMLRFAGRGLEHRIVFTTGDSISARTRDALQRSEQPVLRKPFSLGELREMLERVAGA